MKINLLLKTICELILTLENKRDIAIYSFYHAATLVAEEYNRALLAYQSEQSDFKRISSSRYAQRVNRSAIPYTVKMQYVH